MPSTQNPTPADTTPDNVLRILSGLHAGASRTLAEQEMILVGSGDDCDIVLADHGVARHHALLNLTGGMSSLRALDAPLRIDGQPLHPGDPVELRGLQRIQLGDASIAYGADNDPGWSELLPAGAELPGTRRPGLPGLKRLPVIATLAALSLASLAIFAAVMPAHQKAVDERTQLQSVMDQYQVANGAIEKNANGVLVLTGTVKDNATRKKIRDKLVALGIDTPPVLRSGEDIASDVKEVLRTQHINAETRYMGNGVVEASGRFEDMEALAAASQSRAMRDVPGVTRVMTRNHADPGAIKARGTTTVAAAGAPRAAQEPIRIVAVVRGKNPHLVAIDGAEYAVGQDVPGHGRLVGIGEFVQVVDAEGMPHKIVAQPVTPEELAAAAEQQAGNEGSDGAKPVAATPADSKATGNGKATVRSVAGVAPAPQDKQM
jgi:hypothetical protein